MLLVDNLTILVFGDLESRTNEIENLPRRFFFTFRVVTKLIPLVKHSYYILAVITLSYEIFTLSLYVLIYESISKYNW